jgi:hypothetical protein
MPEGLVARILDAWREEAIRAGRPMAKAASKTGARRSGNGAARP